MLLSFSLSIAKVDMPPSCLEFSKPMTPFVVLLSEVSNVGYRESDIEALEGMAKVIDVFGMDE